MNLLALFERSDRARIGRFLRYSALAGLSSTYCFFLVMKAAESTGGDQDPGDGFMSVLQFLLALLVFSIAQLQALSMSMPIVEHAVHDLRTRLLVGLQRLELRDAEQLGLARLNAALASDAQTISQAAGPMAFALQSMMMVVFAIFYLAYISPTALFLTVVVSTATGWVYLKHSRLVSSALDSARNRVQQMQVYVTAMVAGFRELKMSEEKARGAREDAVSSSMEAGLDKLVAQQALSRDYVLSNLAFFALVGTIVFLVPLLREEFSESVSASVAAVMFLITPLFGVIGALPQVAIANVAAGNLLTIEREVTAAGGETVQQWAEPSGDFDQIHLCDARFRYGSGADAFTVGPLTLSLRKGEVLFITGDNGSGKSTLLKLLAGLYRPSEGDLLIDGKPVWPHRTHAFRSMIAGVFADFYLFDRLHGIDATDAAWVSKWLERLELTDKVRIVDGRFSTLSLSTGQRKRLALFAALAERRPILILDEWAADQDPAFRRHFYVDLLPMIRSEGRTVVAITHDETYFHLADRRIHMSTGRIQA